MLYKIMRLNNAQSNKLKYYFNLALSIFVADKF